MVSLLFLSGIELSIVLLICADRHYKALKKEEKKLTISYHLCVYDTHHILLNIHIWLVILLLGLLTDGSNKKGTSWVQDCLSRGNFFPNTSNSEVPSKDIFHTDITHALLIMFCRISKDFSLLIIIHFMRGLAIETRMNLVTGRLESQRARYLSSIPRFDPGLIFFYHSIHSIFFSSHRALTKWHGN